MSRRRRQEEQENNERWVVSYADFITLLLALFIVMYAMSQVNEGKSRVLAGSILSAFGNPQVLQNIVATTPELPLRKPRPRPEPRLDRANDELDAEKARHSTEARRQQQERMEALAQDIMAAFAPFASLVENGQVRIIQRTQGLGVEINAKVLFSPGQALLQEDSTRILEAVAHVLKEGDHAIQVEGHTDNIPISEKYPSNWELSAVRASSVVRFLIENGVDAKRLTALGYGENRPIDSNDTEEGRTHNRRVTVLILSASPSVPSENLPDTITESAPRPTDKTFPAG